MYKIVLFFFQAEDGIRDADVTGVQTCALPISRSVGGQRGRGLSFRYPPTERGVSGMGSGTQGCSLSLFPAVGTLGLCPVRARAKPGALSLCNPSLCPSDDGKDHGHLVALPFAPAGLLAIAKARRLRTIDGVASVLTDARPTRSRKDPSHSAGGGGWLDDFVCASQRRRADHGNAVQLAAQECSLFVRGISGENDLAFSSGSVLSTSGKFPALVEDSIGHSDTRWH